MIEEPTAAEQPKGAGCLQIVILLVSLASLGLALSVLF